MMEALVFLDAVGRLSLKDSKNAQKQTESSNVEFMDGMETSVPKNGNFFIKIGQKAPDTHPEFDGRALIFIKGRNNDEENPNMFDYVVITREGPKKMTITQEEFQNLFLALTPHPKDAFLKGGKGHPDQISLHNGSSWDLEDLDINNKDKSFLNYVFSESIKAARKKLEMPTESQTLSGLLNH